jgi:hypothetical protein
MKISSIGGLLSLVSFKNFAIIALSILFFSIMMPTSILGDSVIIPSDFLNNAHGQLEDIHSALGSSNFEYNLQGNMTKKKQGPTDNSTSTWSGGLELNGQNQYVDIPDHNWFGNSLTIEAWVFEKSVQNWSRLIDFGNGPAADNVLLAMSYGMSGQLYYEVYNGSTPGGGILTPTPLPLNQWVHVAVTQSGNDVTIYKNGEVWVKGTTATPSNIVRTLNYLGKSNWQGDAFSNATIRDVRIWSVARTQQEIMDFMNQSFLVNHTGLQGYWKLNEGAGTTAVDSSGNSLHGAMMGSAWGWDSSINIDGRNDYISLPDNVWFSGNLTIETWVNVHSVRS